MKDFWAPFLAMGFVLLATSGGIVLIIVSPNIAGLIDAFAEKIRRKQGEA